jgi:UDP-N-acetylglucosamine--N-acetylmuramyl-(pentapeptide) pyrophosphoryl-undecaprenol N-acetylglucosamine transferase
MSDAHDFNAPPETYAKLRVLIMAGGTGGHVFPALAVAQHLRTLGAQVAWLGTRRGLESDVVPKAGFELHYLSIGGLRGKGMLTLLLAPFKLLLAVAQALLIVGRYRPSVVLGLGGFVTGPGGVGAWLLRKPLVIHEQNAIPGMTNRWLSRIAVHVLEAFPGAFPAAVHAVPAGNPLRAEIVALAPPQQRFAARDGKLRLLVLGGSLGAQALNAAVPAALALLREADRPKILHQAGKRHIEETRRFYKYAQMQGDVVEFIADMAEAYAWADVVLCRAGALTVSELAAAGVASILVPYPHAVDDHQTVNAKYLTDVGAALLVQQPQLTANHLAELLQSFIEAGVPARARLLRMAVAARGLAQTNATELVVQHVVRAARHGSRS